MARGNSKDDDDENLEGTPQHDGGRVKQERLLWVTIIVLVAAVAYSLGSKNGSTQMAYRFSNYIPASSCRGEATPVLSEKYKSAKQLLLELSQTESLKPLPKGKMHLKWATPVYEVNLNSVVKDIDGFNSELKTLILDHYKKFEKVGNGTMEYTGSSQGVNQMFFEWQENGGGWDNHLAVTKVMQRLQRMLNIGKKTYFESIGANAQVLEQIAGDKHFHAWATVMEQGNYHSLHTHPGHLLSGVYYINTPKDSGDLTFYDPRGTYSPFDDQMAIKPKAGDLYIFPPWLAHEVLSTPGSHSDPRVSIAFNWGLPNLEAAQMTAAAQTIKDAPFGGGKTKMQAR